MSYIQNEYQFNDLFNKRHYPKDTKSRVLPYYVVDNTIHFLLCEENRKYEFVQGTYNILGGHREANETIIECAKRELQEESLNTIPFNDSALTNHFILKKNKRYIIFLPVFYEIDKIISKFEQNKQLLESSDVSADQIINLFGDNANINTECLTEIKCLKWINERDIRTRKMYKSVQDIFKTIITPQNTEISFNNYMNNLKFMYINRCC